MIEKNKPRHHVSFQDNSRNSKTYKQQDCNLNSPGSLLLQANRPDHCSFPTLWTKFLLKSFRWSTRRVPFFLWNLLPHALCVSVYHNENNTPLGKTRSQQYKTKSFVCKSKCGQRFLFLVVILRCLMTFILAKANGCEMKLSSAAYLPRQTLPDFF